MNIQLKNKDLPALQSALQVVSVKPMKAHRGRVKLLAHVEEKLVEYIKDEQYVLNEYIEVKDGQFVRDENNNPVLKDPSKLRELNDFIDDLKNETVTFAFGEYEERYRAFLDYLADAEGDFTVNEALVLDKVLEQYEKGENA